MKKLFLALGISLGLLNSLFAQELDFIALATEGKFNESSQGVKILNDGEMSGVVGGLYQISASMQSFQFIDSQYKYSHY